jgi:hypothetical protein
MQHPGHRICVLLSRIRSPRSSSRAFSILLPVLRTPYTMHSILFPCHPSLHSVRSCSRVKRLELNVEASIFRWSISDAARRFNSGVRALSHGVPMQTGLAWVISTCSTPLRRGPSFFQKGEVERRKRGCFEMCWLTSRPVLGEGEGIVHTVLQFIAWVLVCYQDLHVRYSQYSSQYIPLPYSRGSMREQRGLIRSSRPLQRRPIL